MGSESRPSIVGRCDWTLNLGASQPNPTEDFPITTPRSGLPGDDVSRLYAPRPSSPGKSCYTAQQDGPPHFLGGLPTDNAFIEAFNGRFQAECLNAHWFLGLDDAREKLEAWRIYYNEQCPHGAIRYKAPISLQNHGGSSSQPATVTERRKLQPPSIQTSGAHQPKTPASGDRKSGAHQAH